MLQADWNSLAITQSLALEMYLLLTRFKSASAAVCDYSDISGSTLSAMTPGDLRNTKNNSRREVELGTKARKTSVRLIDCRV